MKSVSAKMFFTVIWKGICQVLGWFFGLFGYKRDGKFAKCVWGVFSVSASIIMAILAYLVLAEVGENILHKYRYHQAIEKEGGEYVSTHIGYIADYDGNSGYLVNKDTGKKVLKGIDWIAKPLGKDTLVCFSDGTKRGYFNKKDGKVIIEPKYDHAWIFSDGIAAVEENGKVKFIDGTGKVVIDNGINYDPSSDGYVFHGNYLVLKDENDLCGLMDRTGKMILNHEYDNIYISDESYICVYKEGHSAVYDKDMNIILPLIDGCATVCEGYIDVTMSDHTMRKYDLTGKLVNDFYISNTRYLRYDTGEVYYAKDSYTDDDGEEQTYLTEQTKQANARLRAYTAGAREGLMTKEGHIVTMPLYQDIEAIGPDTYLCTVSNTDKVVVDGKGQIVK